VVTQGNKGMIHQTERQLAYLVTVTSNLFSYGLPSANARLHSGKAMDDNTQLPIEQRYPDFIICSRVIFLARITSQIASVSVPTSFVSKISGRYCLS
jgi:hypothetical protein